MGSPPGADGAVIGSLAAGGLRRDLGTEPGRHVERIEAVAWVPPMKLGWVTPGKPTPFRVLTALPPHFGFSLGSDGIPKQEPRQSRILRERRETTRPNSRTIDGFGERAVLSQAIRAQPRIRFEKREVSFAAKKRQQSARADHPGRVPCGQMKPEIAR